MPPPVVDPPEPASRSWTSQRLRLHYVDWGNPTAPTLILLHGGRDHCRSWDWVAASLRDRFHVIAPDLRGHGDSAWSSSGQYSMASYVYDLAQLIHAEALGAVSIVAHSLGANVALRYAGIYPDNVTRLVAIEGMGPGPGHASERTRKPIDERMRDWIGKARIQSAEIAWRYKSIEEALARMRAANAHLSEAVARHLTEQAVNRNEDGTYCWKFDPYVRLSPPADMSREEIATLWGRIACPTLLVYGRQSWATNPAEDGRLKYFQNARVLAVEGAGHWVHHDQPALFMEEIGAFLGG
jgi:pimeloyl-ACP methyl ester carboxylesterase